MSLIKAKDTTSNIGSSTQPFEKIYANNLPKKIVVSGDANGTGTFDDNGNMSLSLAVEQNTTGISFKGVLNGENLDNVLEDGYYIQRLDGGAQPNLNYPIALGGMLFVISYRNSQDVVEFTFQQYQSTSGLFFTRSYNKTANKFSDWTSGGEITFTDIVPVGTIARFPEDNINELPNDWSVIDETYDANKVIDGDKSVSQEIKECKENILQDNITTDLLEDYSGISSDYGAEVLKINGKSHQITTNGYQLFDASKLPTKTQGGATVTNNGDGSFTVSGSGSLTTGFVSIYYIYGNSEIKKLLKVGNLYLKTGYGEKVIHETNPYFHVYITNNANERILTIGNNDKKNITQDILDNAEQMSFVFYSPKDVLIETGRVRPMLYQDGDGTWEPFTGGMPSPNPSYPQEIRNALDKPLVSVGRNLCNDKYGYSYSINYNYISSKSYIKNVLKKMKTKTKYTMFLYGVSFIKKIKSFGIKDANSKNPNSTVGSFGGLNKCVFETTDLSNPIDNNVLFFSMSTSSLTESEQAELPNLKVMIVEGDYLSEDLPYEPHRYAETSLNIELRSLSDGTCDVYENNTITRMTDYKEYDGSDDESWGLQSTNSHGIANFTIAINGPRKVDNSMCNRFIYDRNVIAVATREGYYLNETNLFLRFKKEFISTASQLKAWLKENPVRLIFQKNTPTIEKTNLPIIPTFYSYTNIFQSDYVKAHIKYRLRSKADYAISLIENLTKAMTVKSIDGTTSLNVSEILSKTMPIINGISFYDYDVSNSIRELSKYYPTVSLQSENEENIDEQFNQLGDVTQEIPRIENITKEEDNNENK